MDFSFLDHVATMSFLRRLKVLTFIFFNLVVCAKSYTSWIYIGKLQALSSFEPHICPQMSLAPAQRQHCERSPYTMASVRDGALLGINECQHQFRNERWNCSTAGNWQTVFGKIMQRGSREAAFVHAITSAGVTYAVTQACSRGDLLDCSCDTKKTGTSAQGNFEWGGCSDDVKYGMDFAQKFIDASETDRHDARAKMNRHNNWAGRRAVKKSLKLQCKCHGPTQTCPTRTCWQELRNFRHTGEYLKEQYNKAVHVAVRQDGSGMSPLAEDNKRLGKNDLVYLENSPNYCKKNEATGSLGTSGRECNLTSTGMDSCKVMCCGRGHDTERVTRQSRCKCKFHWCCEVRCEICSETLNIHTCKEEGRNGRVDEKKKGRKGRRRKKRLRGKNRVTATAVRLKRSILYAEANQKDWFEKKKILGSKYFYPLPQKVTYSARAGARLRAPALTEEMKAHYARWSSASKLKQLDSYPEVSSNKDTNWLLDTWRYLTSWGD